MSPLEFTALLGFNHSALEPALLRAQAVNLLLPGGVGGHLVRADVLRLHLDPVPVPVVWLPLR